MSLKIKKTSKVSIEHGHYVTLKDASQIFQVSEITLRRRIKSGKVKYEIRNGKYYIFVTKKELEAEKSNSINIEKYLIEKETELNELKKQLVDQKILIEALEFRLDYFLKK